VTIIASFACIISINRNGRLHCCKTRKGCEAKTDTFDREDHDQVKNYENETMIFEFSLLWIRATQTVDIHVGIEHTNEMFGKYVSCI